MQALLRLVVIGKLTKPELSLVTRIGAWIESLRNPRLQRQRKGDETEGLMCRTINDHMR